MLLRLLAIAALLAAATVVRAADTQLQVFDLRHRPATQVAPIVQPLLQQDEVVQAHGFQLILRARPETVAQVRSLLEHLDRAPKRLLISVRQTNAAQTAQQGADAAVRATPGDSEARVRVYGTDAREQGAAQQQIQVLEGNPAFIEFGQSVPVGERTLVIDPSGAAVHDSVRFRDVTSGFYVLPQLTAQRVRLKISPHRDTLSGAGGGTINVQRAETVVEGPIGQWIELGGTVEQSRADGSGVVYRTQDRSEQRGRIAVKVEILP